MDNLETIKDIIDDATTTDNQYYKQSIFKDFVKLSPNTKGKFVERIVAKLMKDSGNEVFQPTNKQHDLRIRFGTKNHKSRIEVKSAMFNKKGCMSMGPINLDQDFDEVIVVLLYPTEVRGYKIDRSILRGMELNGILKKSKQGYMIGGISNELFESYDCSRVF